MSDVQVAVTNANRALANLRRAQQGTWTPERIERVKALAGDGGSASYIADAMSREFGIEISRNAIIGKLTRLGVPLANAGTKSPVAAGALRRGRQATTMSAAYGAMQRRLRALFGKAEPLAELPVSTEFLGITLENLTPGMCRYPQGDGPFLYCGQPVRQGSSYCAHCHGICYSGKPQVKNRDPSKVRSFRSRYGFSFERAGE